jgi:hypothetical protein
LRKPRLEGRIVGEDGQDAWSCAALKRALKKDELEVILEEMAELFALDFVDGGCGAPAVEAGDAGEVADCHFILYPLF